MTLASTPPLIDYVENGVTLVHAIPFAFNDATEIQCTRILTDGTIHVLASGTDFTVTGGGGAAGTVTKTSAGVAGATFRILRATEESQSTIFTTTGEFPAENIEKALDRVTAIAQEVDVREQLLEQRTISGPVNDTIPALPTAPSRVSRFMRFAIDGKSIDLLTASDVATALLSPLAALLATAATPGIPLTATVFTPEAYASAKPSGVVGDGTEDGLAFALMNAALTAAGGGVVWLYPGRTYVTGSQTSMGTNPNGIYAQSPTFPYFLYVNSCTRPVRVFGNGCKIKCVNGGKYGAFNPDGTPYPSGANFFGNGVGVGFNLASPYLNMIRVENCTGPVHVQDFELDGNIQNRQIGGPWGDAGSGIQIENTGFNASGNTGGVRFENIYTHHHGQDCYALKGPATNEAAALERGEIVNVRAICGGRQACSLTGGRGWIFSRCQFGWTGCAAEGSTAPGPVASSPLSGIDLEAEGRTIRDITFEDCEFVGNTGPGSTFAGDVGRVRYKRCRLVGIQTYPFFNPAPGGMVSFEDCFIVGTAEFPGQSSEGQSVDATFKRCVFTNSDSASPTGATYALNNGVLLDNVPDGLLMEECTFIHDRPVNPAVVIGSRDQTVCRNCEFITKQGTASFFCRVEGMFTTFTEIGTGKHNAVPLGGQHTDFPSATYNKSGEALDGWRYKTAAGALTTYAATLDRLNGTPVFRGSKVYDPPSLALGASAPIQTLNITGVRQGDIVERSWSADLAGANITAWVSANDLVSFYFTNVNGVNPLDLASGTVKFRVIRPASP